MRKKKKDKQLKYVIIIGEVRVPLGLQKVKISHIKSENWTVSFCFFEEKQRSRVELKIAQKNWIARFGGNIENGRWAIYNQIRPQEMT